MANKRIDIRAAVKAMLLNQTDVGSNVYTNRVTDYWQPELPAINIVVDEETALDRDLSGRKKLRSIPMLIEIRVVANDTTDDSLDTIAGQIEDIIVADESLQGKARGASYTNTKTELEMTGDQQTGKQTLSFDVKYTD